MFFDNPLSKYPSKYLTFNVLLSSVFIKLKRGLELSFDAHFLRIFHKNVPYLILYQLTKFQYQNRFLSQDIKEYVFLNPFLPIDCVMNFKVYLKEKERKSKIQKFEYLENKKRFSDEVFHKLLRAIIW